LGKMSDDEEKEGREEEDGRKMGEGGGRLRRWMKINEDEGRWREM